MAKVILVSGDGVEFQVGVEIAKCSETIGTMLELFGVDQEKVEKIPVLNVKGEILKLVLKWAEHHHDPLAAGVQSAKSWEDAFLGSIDRINLFALLDAANYLNMGSGMIKACAGEIARRLKGKTCLEMRRFFEI